MNEHDLVRELGGDADLLTEPDATLEHHRRHLSQQIDQLVGELDQVLTAQRAKRHLQQTHRVAVRLLSRDPQGRITDVQVRVMPVQDAIAMLSRPLDHVDVVNRGCQLYAWDQDGFDLQAAAVLR